MKNHPSSLAQKNSPYEYLIDDLRNATRLASNNNPHSCFSLSDRLDYLYGSLKEIIQKRKEVSSHQARSIHYLLMKLRNSEGVHDPKIKELVFSIFRTLRRLKSRKNSSPASTFIMQCTRSQSRQLLSPKRSCNQLRTGGMSASFSAKQYIQESIKRGVPVQTDRLAAFLSRRGYGDTEISDVLKRYNLLS